MTSKTTPAASNSGLPIDPRTGKQFTSIAALAAHEHGTKTRAALALAAHHLAKGKTRRR